MRILAALMFSMILLTTTLLLHAVATNEPQLGARTVPITPAAGLGRR